MALVCASVEKQTLEAERRDILRPGVGIEGEAETGREVKTEVENEVLVRVRATGLNPIDIITAPTLLLVFVAYRFFPMQGAYLGYNLSWGVVEPGQNLKIDLVEVLVDPIRKIPERTSLIAGTSCGSYRCSIFRLASRPSLQSLPLSHESLKNLETDAFIVPDVVKEVKDVAGNVISHVFDMIATTTSSPPP
ncbi:hypothetical protein BJ322DRAFT_1020776 [Thelephora terrestris]|uniref:Uncharacterized protein n=1 Tax=Thelephora terrestris TaxID=56493 RepID=A0A9P6HEF3_9AGAM|nr:hypothetical protein BJ322DRAFT_1020776 [Thelephora terrestris]